MSARCWYPGELRARIHGHLARHPGLTAYEITRALRLGATRAGTVKRELARMEGDGEARRVDMPRTPTDRRLAVKWWAA